MNINQMIRKGGVATVLSAMKNGMGTPMIMGQDPV